MEREIWKNVEGYQDYFVSDKGRVKSVKWGKERILKPQMVSRYLSVSLSNNGIVKMHRVHRLVAKAFLPNPDNLPIINHRDAITTHNFVDNLEWCDITYNNNYGNAIQKKKATLIEMNLTRPVKQLTLEGEVIGMYPSIYEAARISGITRRTIYNYLEGITKKPKTFKWEFVS